MLKILSSKNLAVTLIFVEIWGAFFGYLFVFVPIKKQVLSNNSEMSQYFSSLKSDFDYTTISYQCKINNTE